MPEPATRGYAHGVVDAAIVKEHVPTCPAGRALNTASPVVVVTTKPPAGANAAEHSVPGHRLDGAAGLVDMTALLQVKHTVAPDAAW